MSGERWLLIGVTDEDIKKYENNEGNIIKNNAKNITFDLLQYDQTNATHQGNITDLSKWREILKIYGPNYFDVIFQDGGLNPGTDKVWLRGPDNKLINSAAINKIIWELLKPDGRYLVVRGSPDFYENGFILISKNKDDPFGRIYKVKELKKSNIYENYFSNGGKRKSKKFKRKKRKSKKFYKILS